MSDEDPEIFPPGKRLPAARRETSPQPMHDAGRVDTGGVVSSTITRWKAEHQSRALNEIAKRHRSEADAIKAYGEMADAFETTARKVNQLRSLPETMALDAAKAKAQRESDYASLGDQSGERVHQRQLTELRRQRELQQAKRELVEENLDLLNSEQGYENQQRNKERNLRIWEKRREAQELDAHVETERVRTELRGGNAPPIPQSNMESMRAKAEEALMTALADGNDAEVERWQRVLDALGD